MKHNIGNDNKTRYYSYKYDKCLFSRYEDVEEYIITKIKRL